ncbi:MAG: hypothetical protein V4443_09870 [Pseudomonadota bacterium]
MLVQDLTPRTRTLTRRGFLIHCILVILLLSECTNLNAGIFTPTPYEIGFQQTFGEHPSVPPEPKALIKTKDGGYAFAGTSIALSAPESSGRGDGFWMVKTDPNGKQQWQRTFGTSGFHTGKEQAYSLVQTHDEGYLLAGYSSAQEFNGLAEMNANLKMDKSAGLVVKFSKDGRLLWHKTYGVIQPHAVNKFYRIVAVEDGYMMVGTTTVFLTDQPTHTGRDEVLCLWLLKIDEEGSVQWEKVFKDINPPPQELDFSHLLADETGKVVLALAVNNEEYDSARWQHLEKMGFVRPVKSKLVLRFDKQGNKTSHVVLPESSMGNINLTATHDGYLASGNQWVINGDKWETRNMWFAWLDKSLALKEHKVVDTQGISLAHLVPTNDGGFYGAGSMPSGSARKTIIGHLGKDGKVGDTTSSGLNSKWAIVDIVSGVDENQFVMLVQAYAQKRAMLLEVIHKPGKER